MPTPALILASASPRRREILERLALCFIVEPADVDETPREGETPRAYVTRLALAKVERQSRPDTVVIGADTTVVLDGEILVKPTDRDDAAAMLTRLSARTHEVSTGVAVVSTGADGDVRHAAGMETTTVTVRPISAERVRWYVETGEADDKAGSYALQGAAGIFADEVQGSVSNVIGLPIPLLDRLFQDLGIDLLSFRTVS